MVDATPLLELEGIETCYGLSQVLFGLSLQVKSGEMVAMMGRNGMGKTTTIRSTMGMTPARAGVIPMMERMVVVLPMPLRPIMATISPDLTCSDRPNSTWLRP